MRGDREHPSPERSEQEPRAQPARTSAPPESAGLAPRGVALDGLGNRAVLALLRSGRLQRKARFTQPEDPREQAADRAASAVLAETPPELISSGAAPAADPRATRELLGPLHGAQSLDEQTRALMESRFGERFDDVRIYSGQRAADAAEAVHSRAFTVGQDIVFAEGEYSPETTEGRRLLAHELAHVVQQRRPAAGSPSDERDTERDAAQAAAQLAAGGTPSVHEHAAPGTLQRQLSTTKPKVETLRGQPIVVFEDLRRGFVVQLEGTRIASGVIPAGALISDDGGTYDPGSRTEIITVTCSKFYRNGRNELATLDLLAGDVAQRLQLSELSITFIETDTGDRTTFAVRPLPTPQPRPVPKPVPTPAPKKPAPRPQPQPQPQPTVAEIETTRFEPPPIVAVPERDPRPIIEQVRSALMTDPEKAARLAQQLSETDLQALAPADRTLLLWALALYPDVDRLDAATVNRVFNSTPERDLANLERELSANNNALLRALSEHTRGSDAEQLAAGLLDVWTRSSLFAGRGGAGSDWLNDQLLRNRQAPEFLPPDVPPVVWAGRPPDWAKDLRVWKDARGNMHAWTPDTGMSVWDANGRRIGLQHPDADKILRGLQTMEELARSGGKRFVEGKGMLDEAGWQAYVRERMKILGAEANQQVESLERYTRLFAETQGGFAYFASVPSHILGGRWFDDPNRIVRDARQDVLIAVHEMQRAQTPAELAEAEQHLKSATTRGEHDFTVYREDVYAGGERTITGIKVGAVVVTAYVSAPVLFTYAGGLTAVSLGGKIIAVGGTALGTGLLTGTMGGTLESAHRGWSWENYGQGFVENAPVGLTYGMGFGMTRVVPPSLWRGLLIDATASGTGGMTEQVLRGGDVGDVLGAGASGFLIGGGMGAFGRGLAPRSVILRVGVGAGGAAGVGWLSGAGDDAIFQQALMGGAFAAGGALGERGLPNVRSPGRWIRTRAAAGMLGLGVRNVPGLSGKSWTPSLPPEPATVLVVETPGVVSAAPDVVPGRTTSPTTAAAQPGGGALPTPAPSTANWRTVVPQPAPYTVYNLPVIVQFGAPATPIATPQPTAATPALPKGVSYGEAAEDAALRLHFPNAGLVPQKAAAYDGKQGGTSTYYVTTEKKDGKPIIVLNEVSEGAHVMSIKTLISATATPELVRQNVNLALDKAYHKEQNPQLQRMPARTPSPTAGTTDAYKRVYINNPSRITIIIQVPGEVTPELEAAAQQALATNTATEGLPPVDVIVQREQK